MIFFEREDDRRIGIEMGHSFGVGRDGEPLNNGATGKDFGDQEGFIHIDAVVLANFPKIFDANSNFPHINPKKRAERTSQL